MSASAGSVLSLFELTLSQGILYYFNIINDTCNESWKNRSKLPERTTIDADTIALLERLSLVDCANKLGIATLEAAIEFADQIHQVDTVGVEPLITVLEDFHLILREDQVVQDCTKVETLSNASITEEDYFVAPPEKQGFIRKNLRREWFNNIVINSEICMFLDEDLSATFSFANNFCDNTLPFGLAQEFPLYDMNQQAGINYNVLNEALEFDRFFLPKDKICLNSTIFLPANDSLPFFHKWQKQRRMWWRKFSPNPGRYSLTDIKIDNKSFQSVDIVAKYSWGNQIVERLYISPNCDNADEFKKHNKTIEACKVVSEVSLNSLFLNTICDAYEESEYKGNSRTFFRFHRKLAPYRISLTLAASSPETKDELNDLALYLTKQLRANNVSTLYLFNRTCSASKDSWVQFDELGIPYNVALDENTLKNGVIFLRSRDTTLKEEVHVSELISYVNQLFKNY
ncbi:hypothetical protein GWI33_007759 [Rhynchophorus ferrugineus]|uniref:Glutamyl-tRNA(Gln) amidotransferase subunit C, mitochondrial n=1 Tax=Rhynchophorus ferrugineus TaxID=354439 RepID=A0A834MKS5_RHYFE|nr:hypothetical protein GWI33_007759 [Rhynchophorus ferrugineus]